MESDLSSSPLWPSLVPKSFSVLILSLKETEAAEAETDELGDADTGGEFMYRQARAAAVAQIPTKLEPTHSHIHTSTHTNIIFFFFFKLLPWFAPFVLHKKMNVYWLKRGLIDLRFYKGSTGPKRKMN